MQRGRSWILRSLATASGAGCQKRPHQPQLPPTLRFGSQLVHSQGTRWASTVSLVLVAVICRYPNQVLLPLVRTIGVYESSSHLLPKYFLQG